MNDYSSISLINKSVMKKQKKIAKKGLNFADR